MVSFSITNTESDLAKNSAIRYAKNFLVKQIPPFISLR